MNINTDYASAMSRILPGTFVPDVASNAVATEPIPSDSPDALAGASGIGAPGSAGGTSLSFRDTLKNYIDGINDKMASADQATQDLATGKTNDINKVVTSVEEANLTMDFAVAMQSKLLSAYQQISEMQM